MTLLSRAAEAQRRRERPVVADKRSGDAQVQILLPQKYDEDKLIHQESEP